jgi:hypothetical protein
LHPEIPEQSASKPGARDKRALNSLNIFADRFLPDGNALVVRMPRIPDATSDSAARVDQVRAAG